MDETEKQSEEEEEAQEIWSWGAGTDGQLATTSLNDQYTPQLLLLLPNSLSCYGQISHLSCGGAHVIALTSGGKVLTWGRGSSGQLGHGGIVPNCLKAMVVSSLLDSCISHVSAGWNHSAFVSDLGCLFTCGDGSFGQLGHGDYQSICSPVEVSSFSSKHVEQVACGMRHTLVLIKGNLEDQIHGFGSNKRGQLSISKDKVKTTSISQPCLGFESIQVASIIANGDHSAAISTDGNLYTWGRSFNGLSDVCVPEIVHSSSKIKEVAMGWNHALLLSGEGEVSMLGGRLHGVLSEPEKIAHDHNLSDSGNTRLRKVPGLDGKKVVQISTGSEHSAIVTENGEIYTWGWGEHGQLGHGNTTDSILPQCVNIPSVDNRGWLTSKVYCGSGFTFAIRTRCHQCSRP